MNYSFAITVVINAFTVWLSSVRVMIVTELTPVNCHDAISVISD
jgi:hypothetical protein